MLVGLALPESVARDLIVERQMLAQASRERKALLMG
jgi:hypothetical protein